MVKSSRIVSLEKKIMYNWEYGNTQKKDSLILKSLATGEKAILIYIFIFKFNMYIIHELGNSVNRNELIFSKQTGVYCSITSIIFS